MLSFSRVYPQSMKYHPIQSFPLHYDFPIFDFYLIQSARQTKNCNQSHAARSASYKRRICGKMKNTENNGNWISFWYFITMMENCNIFFYPYVGRMVFSNHFDVFSPENEKLLAPNCSLKMICNFDWNCISYYQHISIFILSQHYVIRLQYTVTSYFRSAYTSLCRGLDIY